MATVEAAKASSSKSKAKDLKEPKEPKDKDKEKKPRTSLKGHTERLKTVVRRLPPNLPEEVFWQSVQKWVTDDTVTWKEYYQGKFRKRLNKENIPSRAYIAFKDDELLATFSREYDGHVFRDKAGNESIAVVEFAPFQKIPTEKKKVDSRMNTIEKDEDYISFLKSLEEPVSKPFDADVLETLVANSQPAPLPTTTPLLEALKAEKSAQKDKEAILRNHAHYKDMATSSKSHSSKKEDAKHKAATAKADGNTSAPQKSSGHQKQQQSESGGGGQPGTSKKAKKAAAKAAAQAQQSAPTNTPAIAKNTASQQQQQPAPTMILKNQNQASQSAAGPSKQQQPPPPTQSTNPPKAPRAAKERRGSKGAANTNANAPPKQSVGQPEQANHAAASNASAATSDAGASAPSRPRTRPVIGLASRQFEAALSGAVGGRPRRERDGGSSTATTPVSATPAPSEAKSAAPTILQRDERGGHAAGVLPKLPAVDGEGGGHAKEDGAGRGKGRGRGRGRGRGA